MAGEETGADEGAYPDGTSRADVATGAGGPPDGSFPGEGASSVTRTGTGSDPEAEIGDETGDESSDETGDESRDETGDESGRTYGGLFGAFPYAFRTSESRLFRAYVVLGGSFAIVLLLAFTVSIFVAFSNTLGAVGGTFTFSRAFVAVVGVLVALPVLAPVLLVARRHRRTHSTGAYDRALAAAGFGYAFALYVALVVSAPPDMRSEPSGAIAPVVEFLYGLPGIAGLVPPLLAVAVMYGLHRRYRAGNAEA